MASINVRTDDDLKQRAHRELEKLGVTPSEFMRQTLQYVAERGQWPFKPDFLTEVDEALLTVVRERIAAPQRVKILLDDYDLNFDAWELREWQKLEVLFTATKTGCV